MFVTFCATFCVLLTTGKIGRVTSVLSRILLMS